MTWGPDLARQIVEDAREAARLRGASSFGEEKATVGARDERVPDAGARRRRLITREGIGR